MCSIERRCLCLSAGLTAIGAIAGCTPTGDVGTVQQPPPPIRSAPHVESIPSPKPRVPRPGVMHEFKLIGLDQHQIESQLGPPSQEVQHSPAMEALFRAGNCTLSVTLYPDVKTRIYHALAYRMISDVDTDEERRLCSAIFDARLHDNRPVDHATYTPDHGR